MNIKKLTCSVAFLVFGFFIICVLASNSLNRERLAAAQRASSEIANTINVMEGYYRSELHNLIDNKNCDAVIQSGNDFVFMMPMLAGINIVENNEINCSTIFGNRQIQYKNPITLNNEDSIQLIYSGYTPSNSRIRLGDQASLLLAIKIDADKFALFTLYKKAFQRILGQSPYYSLILNLPNASLKNEGVVANYASLNHQKLSEPFYSISYYSTLPQLIRFAVDQYSASALLWCIIAALAIYIGFNNAHLRIPVRRIKRAIKRNEFVPFLQPVFDNDRKVVGAEVLVRWISPVKGVVPPLYFIKEAEDSGLIGEITSSLVDQCIDKLKNTSLPDNRRFKLAFNVCPIQFESERLFDDCNKLAGELSNSNIDLTFEITERQEFASNDLYTESIERLKKRNVSIALDDFGTGHCSLKYLHQVDIDILKIDRSYVDTIDSNSHTKILENIIDLAFRLDVPLVAEGIETEAQFQYLKIRGVDYYQGFMLGRPVPIEEFIELYLQPAIVGSKSSEPSISSPQMKLSEPCL
ncbi:EAL domain-containing protein [Vibrio sp.]|nr:EAL domain-containing protein [Vibrio sp.]